MRYFKILLHPTMLLEDTGFLRRVSGYTIAKVNVQTYTAAAAFENPTTYQTCRFIGEGHSSCAAIEDCRKQARKYQPQGFLS